MQTVERTARIHDFIVGAPASSRLIFNERPDGYNPRIGDRGVRLSGGQTGESVEFECVMARPDPFSPSSSP